MKLEKARAEIITPIDGEYVLKLIERCGRVCYKSENKITGDSSKEFVSRIIKNGHESVLEHYSFTVKFICDRGISHELVRHRIASFSQESTRFCNYSNGRFNNELTFIMPSFFREDSIGLDYWKDFMFTSELTYFDLLDCGYTAQEARSVLPNSIKTEVIMTANIREWRHFFKLRTSKAAHPQMRELTIPLLNRLKNIIPVVFDDIKEEE